MSPAFTSRRRADRFHELVSGRTTHASAGDLDELVDLVRDLRAVPQVAPRPEFSADLRARLMTEADTALATLDPAEARLRMPGRRPAKDRRIATVLGGAALLGATTSMAVAAQSALPGDTLYPIKRALEAAEVEVADDEASRAETLLANASGRLDEVTALVVRGTDTGIAETPSTLEDFTNQAREASDVVLESYEQDPDPTAIKDLRDFTHASMEQLLDLEAQLPAEAHDELVEAARTLTAIDDRARQLCPSCGGAGITEIPRLLLSSASTIGSASVSVPTAERPRRPATSPSAPAPPAPAGTSQDDTGATLPDVELDEDTSATGGDSTGTRSPSTQPGDGATQDPVSELASTLTTRSGDGATGSGDAGTSVESRDPVDSVLEGVQDTSDSLLD